MGFILAFCQNVVIIHAYNVFTPGISGRRNFRSMKLALISDIHANLEALEAVLQSIALSEIDLIVHLGDLVGYNANPRECVDLICERNILCVAGNHDRAVIDPTLAKDFNIIAYQAVIWSTDQLTGEHKAFLHQLPLTRIIEDRFLACHGNPLSPDAYISHHFQGKRVLNMLRQELNPARVCFFGHTHRRAIWYRDVRGKVAHLPISEQRIHLDPDNLYLINPGSVGQPRNQIPLASYAVFDTAAFILHYKLIPYNIVSAQNKILAANLPPYLAERLAEGV
jgi:putative phosphoesterase